MTVTVYASATMSEDELRTFLQLIRGWDRGRPEVKTVISANTGDMQADEVQRIFHSLDPPIPVQIRSEESHPDFKMLKRIQGELETLSRKQ